MKEIQREIQRERFREREIQRERFRESARERETERAYTPLGLSSSSESRGVIGGAEVVCSVEPSALAAIEDAEL